MKHKKTHIPTKTNKSVSNSLRILCGPIVKYSQGVMPFYKICLILEHAESLSIYVFFFLYPTINLHSFLHLGFTLLVLFVLSKTKWE